MALLVKKVKKNSCLFPPDILVFLIDNYEDFWSLDFRLFCYNLVIVAEYIACYLFIYDHNSA